MDDRLENKISMFGKLVEFTDQHETDFTQPIFVTLRGKLNTKFTNILDEVQQSGTVITGYADQKKIVRKRLYEAAYKVANGLILHYTLVVQDRREVNRVKFLPSVWQLMRDSVFYTTSKLIHGKAAGVGIAALAPYGIIADEITELETQLNAYLDLVFEPMQQVSDRGGSLKKLEERVADMDVFLEDELDVFMNTIKFTNTELFASYEGCRGIDDTGSGGNQADEEFEQTIAPMAFFSIADTAELTEDSTIEITNNATNTDVVVGFSNMTNNIGMMPQTISGGQTEAFKVTEAGFLPTQTVLNFYNSGTPGGEAVTISVKIFLD